jgi:hypothetical protein
MLAWYQGAIDRVPGRYLIGVVSHLVLETMELSRKSLSAFGQPYQTYKEICTYL